MPTPASVKLLYDETQNDITNAAAPATWSRPAPAPRSRCGFCQTLVAGVLCFLLGISVGAFIHAFFLSDSNFLQLDDEDNIAKEPFNSTLLDDDDVDENSTIAEREVTTPAPPCRDFPWSKVRLPDNLRPLHYNLTIHPNASTYSLKGEVSIEIDVVHPTNVIVLHADRLHLNSFDVSVDGDDIDAKHEKCPALDQWAFILEKELQPDDEVVLNMHFTGEVRPDLQGLYISTHKHKRSLVTQFEPSFARRMFPCFDEPSAKATFRLSVTRDRQCVARSNAPLRYSKELRDGLILDEFEPTVKMSTYLLAVAVLDGYEYEKKISRETEQPIEVRVYAPSDQMHGQTEFGLQTAVKALQYFEDYFNISYPLAKMDLLALDDFSEGAMENWGLLTFRDSALLLPKNGSSELSQEYIALVVCHEVAHQWFGNLVTMEWWDDLWLNEGFANYMEYRCTDHLFPDWNIMTRFYVDNVVNSQELDALESSRAVASSTSNDQSLMSLFDAIAYHKAAAVISMIHSLAGEDKFRAALIAYLKKNAYDNARGEQLWDIVQDHADLPEGVSVKQLASAYTTQEGHPVVRVDKDKRGRIVVRDQERFFLQDEHDDSEEDVEWPVPLRSRTAGGEEQLHWMKPGQKSVTLPLTNDSDWIIINAGGVGYFKTLYDEDLYELLVKQLKDDHEEIPAVDRTMLLNDAFDLARTSLLNITTFMDLVEYVDAEDDRMVWTLVAKQLRMIEVLMEETKHFEKFQDFERAIVIPSYERNAWKEDISKGLQLELIQTACRLNIRPCRKRAVSEYSEWMKTKTMPAAALIGAILEEAVRQGGTQIWERTLEMFKEANGPTIRQHLVGALAATTNPELVTKLLNMSLEDDVIRPATVPRLLYALLNNRAARVITWRFFVRHYDQYSRLMGENPSLMVSSMRGYIERLSTEEDLKEVKTFLKGKKIEQHNTKIEQLYEQVKMNIQWRRLNEAHLAEWLDEWDEKSRILHRARKHLAQSLSRRR